MVGPRAWFQNQNNQILSTFTKQFFFLAKKKSIHFFLPDKHSLKTKQNISYDDNGLAYSFTFNLEESSIFSILSLKYFFTTNELDNISTAVEILYIKFIMLFINKYIGLKVFFYHSVWKFGVLGSCVRLF